MWYGRCFSHTSKQVPHRSRKEFKYGGVDIQPSPEPGGSRILFVGSANPINVQALEWILGAVFPHIQKKRADSELVVAGEVGRVRRWPNWVSLLGNQDSLVDTYARAAVVRNPVKFGTGLPVKTIEALSYGKRIVARRACQNFLTGAQEKTSLR